MSAPSAPTLVLASTSPWRAELLERLGLPFLQVDPRLDEGPWKRRGLSPRDLVIVLAEAKARALQSRYEGALLIGADQVLSFEGDILGKPGSKERAVEQLLRLQGKEHELITGLALLEGATGRIQTALDVHSVRLRPLNRAQIERYVDRDDPIQCAGSYRLEALGIALFDHVRGDDYSAVIGLPLITLTRLLAEAGLDPLGG